MMDMASANEMELRRVSAVKCAGMTFQPDSWLVYQQGCEDGMELVYNDRILHGWASDSEVDTDHSKVFLRVFRFTFTQLDVQLDVNRASFATAALQIVLDNAQQLLQSAARSFSQHVVPFTPGRISVQGQWFWSIVDLEDLSRAHVARRITLSSADSDRVTFTYR